MKFKSLFVALTPDADMKENKRKIETEKYVLYINLVRNQEEALEIARHHADEKDIDSMILCPGFAHDDVAEILETVGDNVGVTVARGDGPSGKIAEQAIKEAGWFD